MKKHTNKMANTVKKKLIVMSNGIYLQLMLTNLQCSLFYAKKKVWLHNQPKCACVQGHFPSTSYIEKHDQIHPGVKVSKFKG